MNGYGGLLMIMDFAISLYSIRIVSGIAFGFFWMIRC